MHAIITQRVIQDKYFVPYARERSDRNRGTPPSRQSARRKRAEVAPRTCSPCQQ